jgi:hypothetical protein
MQLHSINGGAEPGIDLVFQGGALVDVVILPRQGRRSLDAPIGFWRQTYR